MKKLEVWALPGGFVGANKDVDQEAVYVLKQRTGLSKVFLRQFHLFGKSNRTKNNLANRLIELDLLNEDHSEWFAQRFVTVGYYALVEHSRIHQLNPDDFSEACEWKSLNDLPVLYLDHLEIIRKAHESLKIGLNFQPVGLNLLPTEFTMPELQGLYETILEKKLDRRNFRRKIIGYDILTKTDKKRKGVAHKAPNLYKFNLKKYNEAIEKGLSQTW